jgi:hypothetical protein
LRDTWGIEEIGRETVRGVETTHYRGAIDFEMLMTDRSPENICNLETDLSGTDLSEVFGDFPIDVWIDDNDVMRRLTIAMDFSVLGFAGAATEHVIDSMMMSYEFFNIGGEISIVAPPIDQVGDVGESFLDGFSLAS